MYRYRIHMDNDEVFNVSNDEPIDLDAIAKARWMEIRVPYAKGEFKKVYLNVAQINHIEVLEETE